METAEPQNVALPEEHLQPYKRGKNSGKPLDLRTSRLLQELELFTDNIPVENPVETVLNIAVDKGILPEHARGMNDGVEIVPTRRGYYFVDTTRKNDAPKLKTEELYSNLLKGVEELFDYVELGAASKQWDDVKAQKAYVEKLERARNSWLGDRKKASNHPTRLDRLREEEMRTIKEISKYGRPFVYVSPFGAAWIDEQLAKEKLPKVAAALKYLAPHGTGDAKSLATHVCGMVGDLYSGKMPDFNPTLLGGEIWSNLLMELEPETTAKKSLGKKLAYAGVIALLIGAGAYGAYNMFVNTPRNRFIDSAKAKGYSEADAGRTWDDIQKAVSNDGRISAKDAVTMDTANSMLGLGYVGNYATATRQAVANLTAAYRLGLPKLDSTSMRAITNATQLDGDIVNFQPIKVKDTNGNDVLVGSTNVQRDFWLIANLLGKYTGLAKQPEKHEWVNEMVKQVAYDGMRGDSNVSDGFLKVLYGFHEYMDALPGRMATDGLGDYVTLHYLDSAKLRAEIPDRTNRTVALMYLAHIPRDFHSVSTNESATGIPGMQLFVDSLGPKYAELKNGFFNEATKKASMDDYHYWLTDRYAKDWGYDSNGNWVIKGNRLENTVRQYVGVGFDEKISNDADDFYKLCEDSSRNGLNQLLNKNWGKPWDMIKFIKGYDTHTVGEVDSYRYSMPLSFKAMGVPYGRFLALPYISGTSLDEWAVSVPTSVLNAVKAGMGNQKIVSGYGNMVSLYSCVDGAQKDGITMITQSTSTGKGDPILWKK